ncbi:MAG TPA: ACT domain-containing protein, partial [Actinomycetota bacterium]|nr:ACT domain-containing protein [Actinomycetota bacterium]
MRHLTVTATGKDRPGIVAAVTGALLEVGCNLSDCSMAL